MGFCDGDDMGNGKERDRATGKNPNSNLACLEELVSGIESSKGNDPWKNFPALRLLLKERQDWDSAFPTFRVEREFCHEDKNTPCDNQTQVDFGAKDIMDGRIFEQFNKIWKEKGEPLGVKFDQLRQSWWHSKVPNMLDKTPDRPHIKHVILAYGTDISTEVGYVYRKTDTHPDNSTAETDEFDGVPSMSQIIWEERHGRLVSESQIVEPASFTDTLLRKKKDKRRPLKTNSWLHHSGDGTVRVMIVSHHSAIHL